MYYTCGMEKEILVIEEYDHEDKERCVIGLASSKDDALRMIKEYYVNLKLIKELTSDEYAIESVLKYEIDECYKVTVTLEWFIVDEL